MTRTVLVVVCNRGATMRLEEVWLSRTQLWGQSRPGKNVPLGQSSAELPSHSSSASETLFHRSPRSVLESPHYAKRFARLVRCAIFKVERASITAQRRDSLPIRSSAARAVERCVAPLARLGFPAVATHTPTRNVEHVLTISFLTPHHTIATLTPLHSPPGRYT